jgi:hypothetical protein
VTHPLPCFLQEYDSMRVSGWGCAKNVILKGILAGNELVVAGSELNAKTVRLGWVPWSGEGV